MKLKVFIKALSPLTVGYVGKPYGPDIAFNELGIPSSTLKGVLRASLSLYISEVENAGLYSSCGEVDPDRIRQAHEKMGKACDVCSLFGYPESRGAGWKPAESKAKIKVRWIVEDFAPNLETITRIAVDDLTGTVKEGSLFTQEYLPPGSELSFEVSVLGGCRELEMVLIAFEMLRFYRFGREGMVDLRVENWEDAAQHLRGCGEANIRSFSRLMRLKSYMWGD